MRREPLLLAFDTSTAQGSVGVGRGTQMLATAPLPEARAHASALVPQIEVVLGAAAVDRGDLEGIVVGRGPGSFTGVRVAAATARGLSLGLRIPVWGVSSLAAAALSFGPADGDRGTPPAGFTEVDPDDPRPRVVLFDARSDRVYSACYLPSQVGLTTLIEPAAGLLGDALAMAPKDAVFCGDAALRHAGRIREAGYALAAPPLGFPTAEGLLHACDPVAAAPLEGNWEPDYLRDSSARPSANARGPA